VAQVPPAGTARNAASAPYPSRDGGAAGPNLSRDGGAAGPNLSRDRGPGAPYLSRDGAAAARTHSSRDGGAAGPYPPRDGGGAFIQPDRARPAGGPLGLTEPVAPPEERQHRATAPPHASPRPTATSGPAPSGTPPSEPAEPRVRANDPRDAVPPWFAPGSPAARLPWVLTVDPSPAPGVAADQASLGDLAVRAASVVGPGHRCEEPASPRQDAYRLGRDASGHHLIAAVADGMSDSRRAELGAQVAVARAVALVRSHLDGGGRPEELSAPQVFAEVARAVAGAAADRSLDPADVRTTLTVLVVPAYPDRDGCRVAWAGRVADTHVWLREDGWTRVTGEAKPTLDGNVLRDFLPHVPGAATGTAFVVPPDAVLGVLSDGVGDLFDDEAAARWFATRWAAPPPLASFILDVDFEAKGHLDDRTAVVVWCGAAAGDR